MLGTIINGALILLGGAVGLLFRNRISETLATTIRVALALCVVVIGVQNAIGTANVLTIIICMAVGTLLGEAIRIEERLDHLGDFLQKRVAKNSKNSRFTEGFVTASLLYCVGSMAIMGSLEAGINHDYSILISKGVIDGVTSITFAAAMGVGVLFSVLPLFIYQGALTLLAGLVGPFLGAAVVTEMSAVGGAILIGIAINMLAIPGVKLRVGNMLPAIFLPIVYVPLAEALGRLF